MYIASVKIIILIPPHHYWRGSVDCEDGQAYHVRSRGTVVDWVKNQFHQHIHVLLPCTSMYFHVLYVCTTLHISIIAVIILIFNRIRKEQEKTLKLLSSLLWLNILIFSLTIINPQTKQYCPSFPFWNQLKTLTCWNWALGWMILEVTFFPWLPS